MLKVYGIPGRTTAVVRIPTAKNKSWLILEFKRGRHGDGQTERPCTYVTNDQTVQNIIENSSYYGGTIKLIRSYDADGREVAAPLTTKKPSAAKTVPTSVPDVKTRDEAVAYLKRRGAKANNLTDDESIKAFAARIAVTFPNLTL